MIYISLFILGLALGYFFGHIRRDSNIRAEIRNALITDRNMFNKEPMDRIRALEQHLDISYSVTTNAEYVKKK